MRSRTLLLDRLRAIVGSRYVLTEARSGGRFTRGYRYGEGPALAVVRPGSLLEQWRVFQAVVEAGCIVIMQAANTGLNGGSTPYGTYDRDVVVINTLRISRVDVLRGGEQVLCLAGSTLHQLEQKLAPLGREPHSIIGSTTMGASVVGGVCNNSGGALLRRGPAFTQLALFGRVNEQGRAVLVNHLGIELGENAEEILGRLDAGDYTATDVLDLPGARASDPDYGTLIRDIDAPSPSRFNNDPRLLFEASGSAGKLCVFAVRLDTFPKSGASRVFYVGSNDFMELTNLRRHILGSFTNLPVAGEYLHRDAYRLAEVYGKDLYLYLKLFGASQMAKALRLKGKFDTLTERMGMGRYLSDALLQFAARLLPPHLPNRMTTFRDRFEHHLLLRMDGDGVEEVRKYLQASMPSATGDFFECDQAEGEAAFRHRYAVGGASVRYRALHRDTVENIVALDLAMPRNTLDWRETLPDGIEDDIVLRIPCGHFFCNVFHYDYAVRKGADWLAIEHRIIAHLAGRGIEFPAEHNVGHLYEAKPILRDFFRTLDPTNSMNPGIGGTPRGQGWS